MAVKKFLHCVLRMFETPLFLLSEVVNGNYKVRNGRIMRPSLVVIAFTESVFHKKYIGLKFHCPP